MRRFLSLPIIAVLLYFFVFLSPLLKGYLPIPGDTIVGLYNPWRDFYSQQYPSGIPYKNFLVTDPVRQQLIWKKLVIDNFKSNNLPLWNPYSFSGMPLSGNFQSAAYYPLNIIFAFLPFIPGWSIQVILQTVLGAIFMFLYLRSKKISSPAVALGTISWIGSGFFIAWWSLNTLVSCAIYLPLCLLSIDRLRQPSRTTFWILVFCLSLVCSFLAGALQIFLYSLIFIFFYALFGGIVTRKFIYKLLFGLIVTGIIIFPQIHSILVFFQNSSRTLNLSNWQEVGWFLPWQNLIQFIAPDYFGNPATLNYFGVWNYMEFVGYIGIIPLIFASIALFKFRPGYKFFVWTILISLVFMLPTFFSKIPYLYKIPIFSLAQPTRIMFLLDFSLSVLCALGFDWWIVNRNKTKINWVITSLFFLVVIVCFLIARQANWQVSVRNLYLPFGLLVVTVLGFLFSKWQKSFVVVCFLLITSFELARFGLKFEPFSDPKFIFPQTKTTDFLQKKSKEGIFRVVTTEDRVFPENFLSYYQIQSVGGYDSAIISRYGELISSLQRNSVNKTKDLGFNRIVIPNNIDSKIFGLLNVRYAISLSPVASKNYKLVFSEGETKVYESQDFFPRAFFVKNIIFSSKKEVLDNMFASGFNPKLSAIVEDEDRLGEKRDFLQTGNIKILSYSSNRIELDTDSGNDNYLVLLDVYYPNWKVSIDGISDRIYPTDYAFRGIFVPAGSHKIVFSYSSF